MKANFNSNKEYVAPEIELISVVVEHGFEVSYGDYGEAGGGFNTDDNGDF